AALFTVAAASASISPPLLAHSGSASSSSSSSLSTSVTEASSLVAKPLAGTGTIVEKYVAKLKPSAAGCKGASGKAVVKLV
ncbi:unnamed protein product, partial [Closterium sp. NIES-64]